MRAGRGHLERALGMLLALDLGEIGVAHGMRKGRPHMPHQLGRIGRIGKVRADLEQRARRQDLGCVDQRRFVGIGQRQDEGPALQVGL